MRGEPDLVDRSSDTPGFDAKQRGRQPTFLPPYPVSRETEGRLQEYLSLLRTWNHTINLVSRGDELDLRQRHIEDSLSLANYITPGTRRLIDLGSGGGLPAIPLAIVLGLHVDLVESDRRKAAFLRTAIATLGVNGSVWNDRVETSEVPPAPHVTARAFAPLVDLLGYANRLLQEGGIGFFLKGPSVDFEIAEANKSWQMHVSQLPTTTPRSIILRISDLRKIEPGKLGD